MNGTAAALAGTVSISISNVLAGIATQKSNWLKTFAITATTTLVLSVVVSGLSMSNTSAKASWVCLAAGIVGGLGLPLAYTAFAHGRVSSVGPTMTLSTALVLSGVSFTRGELTLTTWVPAMILGAIGVKLTTLSKAVSSHASAKPLVLAGIAGVMFASYSILLKELTEGERIAGLVFVRIGVVIAVVIAFLMTKTRRDSQAQHSRKLIWLGILAGITELSANFFTMLALTSLPLSTLGIIQATGPAFVTILGALLLKQMPSVINWIGVALSVIALVFLTI